MAAEGTIARVQAAELTPDDFVRQFVAENTPVILEGALPESWSSAYAWTPERLRELAPPGTRLKVAPLMADGRDKWLETADLWPGAAEAAALPGVVRSDRVLAVAASRIEVTPEDFAASLQGQGPLPVLYADGAANADHSFGFLAQQLAELPQMGAALLHKRYDLWLGGRTRSTLHFDNYENLYAQLVGEKEFILHPPGDTKHLVDGRLRKAYATWQPATGEFQRTAEGLSEEAVMNYAAYSVSDPPPEYTERAKKLKPPLIVRVRAGELFYLPFGWWHEVHGFPAEHGLCASAACFFEPFFVRLQPKHLTKPGPLLPNPKYRKVCTRLGLDSDDENELQDDRKHG